MILGGGSGCGGCCGVSVVVIGEFIVDVLVVVMVVGVGNRAGIHHGFWLR